MTVRASVLRHGPRALTIVAAALSLVVVGQVAVSMNASNAPAETVLHYVPGDAHATARQAWDLAQTGKTRDAWSSARQLAVRALAKEPTDIIAVRAAALASAQSGNLPRAGKLFDYAEALTRRDLITHIWFIETAAERGDVATALRHYDLALRTSRAAGTQLFPVLAHATSDPEIARQLADFLASGPPWADGFYRTLIGQDVPPETVASFVQRLHARGVKLPNEVLDGAIANLAAAQRADLAWKLYQATAPASAASLLRNGSFDRADRAVPFEWQYAQEGSIAASREAEEKSFVLAFRAEGGASGEIARQMIALAPGRYRLEANVGLDKADNLRLEWQVVCVGQAQPLANLPAESAAVFSVPAGQCPQQWLALKLVRAADTAAEGRVANVRLQPQPGS